MLLKKAVSQIFLAHRLRRRNLVLEDGPRELEGGLTRCLEILNRNIVFARQRAIGAAFAPRSLVPVVDDQGAVHIDARTVIIAHRQPVVAG